MDCAQWWGPGFHGFWIFPLVFMFLMLLFVAFLLRRIGDGRGGHGHGWGSGSWWNPNQGPWAQRWGGETPRQILDRRYASGDITKEQYDEMKRDIESGSSQA